MTARQQTARRTGDNMYTRYSIMLSRAKISDCIEKLNIKCDGAGKLMAATYWLKIAYFSYPLLVSQNYYRHHCR